MEKKSIVKDKSFAFSLRIIDLYVQLKNDKEYDISRQLLKAGTSIGANIEEALAGYSDRDFAAKMSIASKEARETRYWLRLINESQHFKIEVSSLLTDCVELIKMLTAIVKTIQTKNNKT